MSSYTVEFKEEAVRKILMSDGRVRLSEISKSIGVSVQTLRKWLEKHHEVTMLNCELSQSERINAVLSTLNLSSKDKSSYCRQHGLLPDELETWELEMKQELKAAKVEHSKYAKLKMEKEALKTRLDKTEKELQRKEKALAEAASLLVLQKKVHQLLVVEEESMSCQSESDY